MSVFKHSFVLLYYEMIAKYSECPKQKSIDVLHNTPVVTLYVLIMIIASSCSSLLL